MRSAVETQSSASPDPRQSVIARRGSIHQISWLRFVLHFSPFFLLVWFVSRFSVNVPQVDEWFLAYLFHAVRFKTARFSDFFELANEHRIVFPRLIWTALAFQTHWNLKVEMMFHLVLALIIFAVFYWLAVRQAKQTGSALLDLAIFSTSLLVFSLAQYQTWLWAFAGGYLFVQAAVALAIGVCFIEKIPAWARFGMAALFCFAASFSQAWGLSSWLALFPCILLLQSGRRKATQLWLWGFLFFATVALYFHHFRFLKAAGDPLGFLSHPLRSAGFFAAVLGTPFCQGGSSISIPLACLAGGAMLAALAGCLVRLRGYEHKEIAAPWLSAALFGLFFAAMVTAGRSNAGFEAAVQSRYATGAVFVAVAVIQLGRLLCAGRGQQLYLFLAGALWSLIIASSISSIVIGYHLKEDLSHAKLFVEIIPYIDPATDSSSEGPFFPLYPTDGTGNIRTTAALLNEIGFLHLASNLAFVDHPLPDCGLFESADGSGDLLHLRRDKDEVTVSGWASLPQGRGLPKVVMISYGERKTFITGAVVGWVDRPDIAALRRDPRYFHSGWKVSFPAKFLPAGEGVLKAWVYDAAEKKFIRMPESGEEKRFKAETQ